ncbi:hypothetical protein JA9_002301 [Meyerozyma sp. JA9]|nr:hypothetical protein JA9_002301 [Meyerozyma sp. JA9]
MSEKSQAPSKEDQEQLKVELKKALNPNGENPQIESYVDSTFSYISESIQKMEQTDDKDKTANDIAEDLGKKIQDWLSRKQKELDAEKRIAEKQEEAENEKA